MARRYKLRFTPESDEDLLRLYDFLLEKEPAVGEAAVEATTAAVELLRFSPLACRKALTLPAFTRRICT